MDLQNFRRKTLSILRTCKDLVFFSAGILYFKKNKINIDVLSIEETISIANCKSVIRFGDGEIALINGKKIIYQSSDEKLASKLNEIINTKSNDVLICLPDIFHGMKELRFKDRYFHTKFLFYYRKYFMESLTQSKYGNTFMSRPYMIFKDKKRAERIFQEIKKIWQQKEIVIIEGAKSKSGVGNTLFSNAKKIERIICPSENAFSKSDEIIQELLKMSKDKIFLFALGPTSKIIIYELMKLGYHAIDIGHLDSEYEWSLRKAKDKVKIIGKHTAEFEDDGSYEDINDDKYLHQIKKIIK